MISDSFQQQIIQHGLTLSAALVALYLLSWMIKPEIWTGEITNGEQKGDSRGYIIYLVLLFGTITGYLVYADNQVLELSVSQVNQTTLFAANWLITLMYGLIDLFVIDFIIYIRLKPKFMEIEGVQAARAPLHHIKYFIRFMVFSGVFAFIASIVATRA